MPYIPEQRRLMIAENHNSEISNPGELNYAITILIRDYFNNHSNYQGINDILGAIEGAKLEFYRRRVLPYENIKMDMNGDVY